MRLNSIQSYIVFCLVHIRKDLGIYFDKLDHEILTGFDEIRREPLKSFEYLDFLKRKKIQHAKSKGYKCLDLLIQRYENWLPILIIQHGLNLHFNSSRIEGLFGLFKSNYGLKRGKIITVIKSLNNLCGVLKTESYSDYTKTYKDFSDFPLVRKEDLCRCGRMILDFLQKEYDAFILGNEDQPCVWCELRKNKIPYTIPCRHSILKDHVIDI